ncbi:MFS family permease [Conyzicola nivalis]|uniref:MFS family permease n=1 Tax=Conyzicola nivalis TaxID=1477021 RepID=A0ABV2QIB4_9MICO
MANPGVYFPHASDTAWPFLAFVGAVFSVPLLGLAILMLIAGHVSRMRTVAGAVLALAIAAASVAGLITAGSEFRKAETAHRIAYLGEARAWLERGYGVTLTEAELSELVTTQGISGQFEGATAFITIRGDRDTGNLLVTGRDGEEIPPLE